MEKIMKTAEELNALKEEIETLSKKLAELTEEELAQVTGGLEYKITFKSIGVFVSQPDIDKDLKPEQVLQTYGRGSDKNAKVILK